MPSTVKTTTVVRGSPFATALVLAGRAHGVVAGVFRWAEQWIAGAHGHHLDEGRVNAWWFAENYPHLSGVCHMPM